MGEWAAAAAAALVERIVVRGIDAVNRSRPVHFVKRLIFAARP